MKQHLKDMKERLKPEEEKKEGQLEEEGGERRKSRGEVWTKRSKEENARTRTAGRKRSERASRLRRRPERGQQAGHTHPDQCPHAKARSANPA